MRNKPLGLAAARLAEAAPLTILAFLLAGAVWGLVFGLVPSLEGMEDEASRLALALKCLCIAVLAAFLPGLEAVSHERLFSDGFDPLSGGETRRLRINQRYVQNTVEQTLLFAPGILALALYAPGGEAVRSVIAATIVWILARLWFWAGYHHAPHKRIPGLVGFIQSLAILIHVAGEVGREIAGTAGAAIPVLLLAAVEIWLIAWTLRPPDRGARRKHEP